MPVCNRLMADVIAEFDQSVVFVDLEKAIKKEPRLFWHDGAHFSDAGHAAIADEIFASIMKSPALTNQKIGFTAVPPAPLPANITFLTSGVTAANTTWSIPTGATTELFAGTYNRIRADLRRAKEAKFGVHVRTVFSAAAVAAVQFSIDNGTTWFFLTKSVLFAPGTGLEVTLATLGERLSAWEDIAPEALVQDCLLRVVGLKAGTLVAGVFGGIYMQVR
jgi:hypothetical protein